MMTTYAYLRLSTDQQDVDNQRYGLFVYANTHGLGPLQFVEDTASGRLAWRDRVVGRLLIETVHAGDAVLFAEISRMARSTLQLLEMLEHCLRQGVSVHIAKQQLVLDGSIQSRITATVLGLAAEIEREMISLRTIEAVAIRQASGLPLGRPKGTPAARRKLDAKEGEIRGYLAKGISKRSIAKLVDCAPSTLYDWLARRNLRSRQATTVRRS
jgi:DNA invertase Pin-like site-specific DNA recombinase